MEILLPHISFLGFELRRLFLAKQTAHEGQNRIFGISIRSNWYMILRNRILWIIFKNDWEFNSYQK